MYHASRTLLLKGPALASFRCDGNGPSPNYTIKAHMPISQTPETEALTVETLTEEDQCALDLLHGNTARLGIVWTATGIAGWVGANLASGVVSAIGGKAFGEALNAIGLGGPNVGELLKDISNRLKVVEDTVKEIKALVLQLLSELEALRLSMDQSFLEAEIRAAFTQIDAAYGTAAQLRVGGDTAGDGGAPAPSFMELLTSLPKTKTAAELAEYAKAFVQAEGAQWNLTTQIQSIHNALTEKTGHGESLLTRWTDGLLFQIGERKIDHDRAYKALESYFLQAVAKQLTAVAMHCFALGTDQTRIDYFVRTDFGSKMKRQTGDFLRSAERLMLGNMRLKKVPSTFTMEQSGEFPSEMEPVLLRADLVCAALNLVSNTLPKNTAKEAIEGIYGRVLARPGDIIDNRGPAIALPGYAQSQGIPGTTGEPLHVITSLHPVDLQWDGNRLVLGSRANSNVTVVRYFWPWPVVKPPQGVVIDSRMRGGVRPAFFNVLNDRDWPLAAGFVDFSRLLKGAPLEMPNRMLSNTQFASAAPHGVVNQTEYIPPAAHLLARSPNSQIRWRFDHSSPLDGTWLRQMQFYFFTYAGETAKLRLTVNVRCEVEHTCSVDQGQFMQWGDNDMNARVTVQKHGGNPSHTFYNSETEGGGNLFLIHRSPGYAHALESWCVFDLDVSEGGWLFNLDFKNWVGSRISGLSNFRGWKLDTLIFDLKGVYLEWV